MPATIELTHDLPDLAELMLRKAEGWQQLAMGIVKEGASTGERVMRKEATDAGLIGVTGWLRNSITSTVGLEGEHLVAWIRPEAPYAQVMDEGRRPGGPISREGRESIEKWAVRKIGKEGLGYVIARSIIRKGIKGRKYIDKTEKVLAKAIPKIAERHITEWLTRDV